MLELAASKIAAVALAAGLIGLAATFVDRQGSAGNAFQTLQMDDGHSFEMARYEVTRGEWQACHDAGGCGLAAPQGDDKLPMTGVNAFDVAEYIGWINHKMGGGYRLPSQAEWQVAARDMPKPVYKKLFSDPRLAWAADYNAMPSVPRKLRPSGGFGTFGNGIYDLSGNVWEWTSTCGTAGVEAERCPGFVVEGQHAAVISVFVRDPASGGCSSGTPPAHVGFRLVRD